MASTISRRVCTLGRPGAVEGGRARCRTIRHRRGRFGMLFSCSVEYRATPRAPLFGQFLNGVLRSSHIRRSAKSITFSARNYIIIPDDIGSPSGSLAYRGGATQEFFAHTLLAC